MTATIIAILAAVPQGLAAVKAIVALINEEVADQARRDFLIGCTDMVREILDQNMSMDPSFAPEELVEECKLAIVAYGRRMGQPVNEAAIAALGF